eukprot:XP_001692664.1 predicted protein [Chlamydomonas reinhardtii]
MCFLVTWGRGGSSLVGCWVGCGRIAPRPTPSVMCRDVPGGGRSQRCGQSVGRHGVSTQIAARAEASGCCSLVHGDLKWVRM